jgi:hypothetical protein
MKAQSLGEYMLVISIVLAAMMAMFPMVKRGTQSLIKTGADQIGSQKNAEQDFSADSGYTDSVNSVTHAVAQSTRAETPGSIVLGSDDRTETLTNSLTNMGFTRE